MMTSNDQNPDDVGCDIVDLVRERNAQIRQAFANVTAADGAVKAALFDELVTILAVREAVAKELVRPLVERQGPTRSAVRTGPADQAEVEVISGLSLLSSMDIEDDTFDVELIGVARKVILQIDAQERDDLPLLRRSLPAEELHALVELLLSAETTAGASALAIETEITSPDALAPRDVLAALRHTMHGTNRA